MAQTTYLDLRITNQHVLQKLDRELVQNLITLATWERFHLEGVILGGKSIQSASTLEEASSQLTRRKQTNLAHVGNRQVLSSLFNYLVPTIIILFFYFFILLLNIYIAIFQATFFLVNRIVITSNNLPNLLVSLLHPLQHQWNVMEHVFLVRNVH